jgi:hypothetical protein
VITLLLPLLLASDPVVPIAGRPVDFSGAVGGPFVVTMKVDKTEFPKEYWLHLIVTVTGPGDLSKIELPDLNKDPEWNSRFQVDPRPNDNPHPDPDSRNIEYVLRAKNYDVRIVPRLKFTYFNPAIKPANKGWQTTYAEPINVVVELPKVIGMEVGPAFRDWQYRILSHYPNTTHAQNAYLWVTRKLGWEKPVRHHVMWERMFATVRLDLGQQLTDKSLPRGIASLIQAINLRPWDSLTNEGLDLARELVAYPTDTKTASLIKPEVHFWPNILFDPRCYLASIGAWIILAAVIARTIWKRIKSSRSRSHLSLVEDNRRITGFGDSSSSDQLQPSRSGRAWKWCVVGILLVMALLPAINFGVMRYRESRDTSNPPIVVKSETELRTGNGIEYPSKLTVPRGVEAREIARRGDWVQIEFASGRTGWVINTDLIHVFLY